MPIKTIPFSRLETELRQTLNECAATGQTVIVEMPDHEMLAIQSLDPHDDDCLTDDLLQTNAEFQALVAKSNASGRRSFSADGRTFAKDPADP